MTPGHAEQEGMDQEALNIYSAMRDEGTANPDTLTYGCLLEACTTVRALKSCQELHSDS